MKITVQNPLNGYEINFLDQRQIDKDYGVEKATLGLEDFINNQDLNLYGYGGNGGLFGLPKKKINVTEPAFSQIYLKDDSKYEQRTVELISNIPALLIERNIDLYDYFNQCLATEETYLRMIIDKTLEGGDIRVLPAIDCAENPLTNGSYNYIFNIFGNSLFSFEGLPLYQILDYKESGGELSYDLDYPIEYTATANNFIKEIYNPFSMNFPIIIEIKDGTSSFGKVTQLETNKVSNYNSQILENDVIIINSLNKSVSKNNQNALNNFQGEFLELIPGKNTFKFEVSDISPSVAPICIIVYNFRYTNA